MDIRIYIKQNTLAIAFALLVGALSVLPHLLASQALGDDYKGIPFLYLNNEDYYLARIHEIVEGNYFVSSPYFFEYKNIIPIIPPVGEYFYVILSFLTGTSLPNTLLVAKFLFPAMLFLLVYSLLLLVTLKNEDDRTYAVWNAIAGALMVTIGVELTNYQTLFSRLLHGTSTEILSMWTRPVNPITGALFLFTFLHLLWHSLTRHSRVYPIVAGITLAFSLGYIFSFGLSFAILCILLCFMLIAKEQERAKRLVGILLISISLPVLYLLTFIHQLGDGALAGRNGLMLMHSPFFNKILLAGCVFFLGLLVFARRRGVDIVGEYEKHLPVWFALSLLLGGLGALNQQVLTGRTIWPFHFVQYTIPLVMVALYIAFFLLLRPFAPRVWKALTTATISICILFAFWNVGTYVHAMPDYRSLQNMAPIFAWLNNNAPKDCVVLVVKDSHERIARFIPGFTDCNVYFTDYLTGGAIPMERVRHNFFTKLRIHGIKSDDTENYLEEHQDDITSSFYKDWFELFNLKKTDRIRSLIPVLAEEYREFLNRDFSEELHHYRIDYIIALEPLPPETKKALPHWSEVAQLGSTTIYSFQE